MRLVDRDEPSPEGDPGAIGADQTDGEFDRALDENQGVKGGFVLGRFLPLEWIQRYEKKDETVEMMMERLEALRGETETD